MTDFVPRTIFPEILAWLDEREIIIITGARQTGKTTILHKLKERLVGERVIYVNFEYASQLENFTRDPIDFVSLQLAESGVTYFLFDEFQYAEAAGKSLKLLFDRFSGRAKFIVTGSSSLEIKEIASFLVGRAVFFELYPFSFSEFLSARDAKLHRLWSLKHEELSAFLHHPETRPFKPDWIFQDAIAKQFEEYAIYGGYPAVALSKVPLREKRLESLTDAYVEKDVVNFLRIGNALEFKKLARMLALQIGNLLNFSSLQTDIGLSYREVRRFIGLLENTFIVKLLLPYAANPTTEIKKSPKVYLVDTGLRNSLVSDFRPLEMRPDKGAVIENVVFNQLQVDHRNESLRFWRTKQGAEVDFILTTSGLEMIPIEVKFQRLSQPSPPSGLLRYIKKYHPQKAIVLNRNLIALKKIQSTEVLFFPIFFA